MNTTTRYGAVELRSAYARHITNGLVLAGLLHLILLGGYRLYEEMTHSVFMFPTGILRDTIRIIPLPPSIGRSPVLPQVSIAPAAAIRRGIPIPIPDTEIHPDVTLASQEEMIDVPLSTDRSDGSIIVVPGGTGIDIDDGAEPPPFQPVEKQPIPVTAPVPAYPEVARRSGIEGIVYVTMLVTKEGMVKKVSVARSTSSLFDAAALEAAHRWTFIPAVMNDAPVSVWVTVPFRFRLAK